MDKRTMILALGLLLGGIPWGLFVGIVGLGVQLFGFGILVGNFLNTIID